MALGVADMTETGTQRQQSIDKEADFEARRSRGIGERRAGICSAQNANVSA